MISNISLIVEVGKKEEVLPKATIFRFDGPTPNANGLISHRKPPRKKKKSVGNMKVAPKRKKKPTAKIKMKSEVCEGSVILHLPLQTVSEANCFEHWTKKHERHRLQQRTVALALKPHRGSVKLPCKIMLTRMAPDELDKFDNLPMSFKYIVDAVCAIITGNYKAGQADSDKRISIACDQMKSQEYGVIVEISF